MSLKMEEVADKREETSVGRGESASNEDDGAGVGPSTAVERDDSDDMLSLQPLSRLS